jgi:hypothetical protein
MATTIRRLKRSVQKAAKAGGLSTEDTVLAAEIVVSIAGTGKVHLSQVARRLQGRDEALIDSERNVSEQLAAEDSTLDGLRDGWLQVVARTAKRLSFITVDGSDIAKPHGKAFEHLDIVRDASDPLKRIVPGYWTVQIDALDELHRMLPLVSEVFSTKAPEYKSWYDAFLRPMLRVLARLGREHTWLFDRGFDAIDFLKTLMTLRIHWVVRQTQMRHVMLGDGELVPMEQLATGLRKPHSVDVPYVDKSNHEPKLVPASFGYAPVRLPGIDAPLTMIVVDGGRGEDIVLLTNARITHADQAAQIVLAYLRRWGSEEATRALKQLTGVEGFRVRKWESIQRLTHLAMMTCGVQALMLLTRARAAARYIARIAQFFDNVLLKNYRLWEGIQDALRSGA